jgi:hypothetical protein
MIYLGAYKAGDVHTGGSAPLARRTVRVRIAVAVDHTGAWSAGGTSEYASDDKRNRECVYLEGLQEGEVFHWVEADVPVPVLQPETVFEGELVTGDPSQSEGVRPVRISTDGDKLPEAVNDRVSADVHDVQGGKQSVSGAG